MFLFGVTIFQSRRSPAEQASHFGYSSGNWVGLLLQRLLVAKEDPQLAFHLLAVHSRTVMSALGSTGRMETTEIPIPSVLVVSGNYWEPYWKNCNSFTTKDSPFWRSAHCCLSSYYHSVQADTIYTHHRHPLGFFFVLFLLFLKGKFNPNLV